MADGFEYSYEADSRIADGLKPIIFFCYLDLGIKIYHCIQRRPYCPGRIHVRIAVQQDANGRRYKLGTVKTAIRITRKLTKHNQQSLPSELNSRWQPTVVAFSLCSSVFKKVQTLPYLNARFLDGNQEGHQTKVLIRSLISLAFTPHGELVALVRYFVMTWIGCDRIWQLQHIPIEEDAELGEYGKVDNWIRKQIQNHVLQVRAAIFPQQIWDM
ncbi:hypothetical protein niasHT_017960 [Heterodera trifolii]|uniref:Uncharacterized protein n=1 Tax=Heterodera trifolii TaxID=157864 RepID=A0ABD2LIP8_9BILA